MTTYDYFVLAWLLLLTGGIVVSFLLMRKGFRTTEAALVSTQDALVKLAAADQRMSNGLLALSDGLKNAESALTNMSSTVALLASQPRNNN